MTLIEKVVYSVRHLKSGTKRRLIPTPTFEPLRTVTLFLGIIFNVTFLIRAHKSRQIYIIAV